MRLHYFILLCFTLSFISSSLAQEADKHFKKGLSYLEKGDTVKALASFEKSKSKNKNFAPSYIQLAKIYEKKDPAKTLRYLVSADSLQPDNAWLNYALGAHSFFTKNQEKAVFYLSKSISLDSTDWHPFELLAEIALREQKLKEAEIYLKKLNVLNPNEVHFQEKYARLSLEKRDGKTALEQIKLFLSKYPENENTLRIQGYSKFLLEDYNGAFHDLERSLRFSKEKDTLDFYAHFYMGLVQTKREMISESIMEFSSCLQIKEDPWAYYNRSISKLYFNDRQGAQLDMLKAYSLKKEELLFAQTLSEFFVENDSYQSGIDFFSAEIRKDPYLSSAYFGRAYLHYENDSLAQALEDVKRLFVLDDSLPDSYLLHAKISYEYKEALFMDREDYMDLDDEIEESFYNKLLLETQRDFEKAKNLAPNDIELPFKWALFYIEYELLDQAIEVLKECMLKKNKISLAAMMLGKIYLDLNKLDLAVEYLNQSIEHDNSFAEAYYQLAVTYYKKGDKDKFCYFLKKAVSLGYETELMVKCFG